MGKQAINDLHKAHEIDQQQIEKLRAAEATKKRQAETTQETLTTAAEKKRLEFLAQFEGLTITTDSQARGYALEQFLNEHLEFEKLNPRGSFKMNSEQIDGSFSWNSCTYLVEAKWIKTKVGGAKFGAFDYKISGKTIGTKGVFISINGYSEQAISGLNGKGALRFICIDGSHLFRALQSGCSFKHLLTVVWRHADETGEAYLPVSSEQFLKRWP